MSKTILIVGGTGLVGSALLPKLISAGFKVHLLSRKQSNDYPTTTWDPEKETYDKETLPEVDVIINLAGEGIAEKRWTNKRKAEIIHSRQSSNRVIQQIISAQQFPVQLYISASAMGIYGDRGTELLFESSEPGNEGFLEKAVVAWEESIHNISGQDLRKVVFRLSMVLSMQGGALPPMVRPVSFCVAPYFGSGHQIYSWIHIDDLCAMFLYAIENESMSGAYNAASPAPVTNREMMKTIKQFRNKYAILISVPVFVLRIMMGELADLLLYSTNVSPERIIASGFSHQYPKLETALKDIFNN